MADLKLIDSFAPLILSFICYFFFWLFWLSFLSVLIVWQEEAIVENTHEIFVHGGWGDKFDIVNFLSL